MRLKNLEQQVEERPFVKEQRNAPTADFLTVECAGSSQGLTRTPDLSVQHGVGTSRGVTDVPVEKSRDRCQGPRATLQVAASACCDKRAQNTATWPS